MGKLPHIQSLLAEVDDSPRSGTAPAEADPLHQSYPQHYHLTVPCARPHTDTGARQPERCQFLHLRKSLLSRVDQSVLRQIRHRVLDKARRQRTRELVYQARIKELEQSLQTLQQTIQSRRKHEPVIQTQPSDAGQLASPISPCFSKR